ncbi:hypothetical protein [Hyphomicrobium sp.]|uniref:hypothetical protein n=1 Tax=Hyphomicrobium sp. TaxID=82 RepID=UPI0025BEA63B|nr:hypothetical protein [Hyphomicrobium sp.]MCC7253937.1 hypothetical protein [Hyphomicrobium sp.]
MRRTSTLMALALGALAALGPAIARADSYWEVEHARANARAGGPVSERDAELLERYGCLSGSKSAFCKQLSNRDKKSNRTERRRARRD